MTATELERCRTGVAILGGGPAGLSAALWLHDLNMPFILLERRERLGGMPALNFLPNETVLGFHGVTGVELAARFADHARTLDFPSWCNASVTAIRRQDDGDYALTVALPDGPARTLRCKAIMLATGQRFVGTEILTGKPGVAAALEQRPDAFVAGPYAFENLEANRGRRVLIVGGGDNAFENAILLTERGAEVKIAVRSAVRASPRMQARLADLGRVAVLSGTEIAAVRAARQALAVELTNGAPLLVDRLHVLAGYRPNSEIVSCFQDGLSSRIMVDERGYVVADEEGCTGLSGVYAIGDVCSPRFQSIVGAIAQGARTAKALAVRHG